ncbi:MAG: hypothetical protein GY759_13460 [Chloroflexi bacterium]|nr:hypothetical protein [Chloroflexota bacterium]
MIASYPELLPVGTEKGYVLHGILPESSKLPGIRFRRIKLKDSDKEEKPVVLTIASSEVMPYMSGFTNDVEKALFLRRFGVPFWGLSYVFGRDDNYWYRITASLGRNSIVDTTVKEADKLPEHVLADEKHSRFNGEKAYIATTVGDDCVLGASLAMKADEPALREAYACFQKETGQLKADYQPKTVNTDGWWSLRTLGRHSSP